MTKQIWEWCHQNGKIGISYCLPPNPRNTSFNNHLWMRGYLRKSRCIAKKFQHTVGAKKYPRLDTSKRVRETVPFYLHLFSARWHSSMPRETFSIQFSPKEEMRAYEWAPGFHSFAEEAHFFLPHSEYWCPRVGIGWKDRSQGSWKAYKTCTNHFADPSGSLLLSHQGDLACGSPNLPTGHPPPTDIPLASPTQTPILWLAPCMYF